MGTHSTARGCATDCRSTTPDNAVATPPSVLPSPSDDNVAVTDIKLQPTTAAQMTSLDEDTPAVVLSDCDDATLSPSQRRRTVVSHTPSPLPTNHVSSRKRTAVAVPTDTDDDDDAPPPSQKYLRPVADKREQVVVVVDTDDDDDDAPPPPSQRSDADKWEPTMTMTSLLYSVNKPQDLDLFFCMVPRWLFSLEQPVSSLVNTVHQPHGTTPLMHACKRGLLDCVRVMLTDMNGDLTVRDSMGQTALWHAVTGCHLELVAYLLDNIKEPLTPTDIVLPSGESLLCRLIIAGTGKRDCQALAELLLLHMPGSYMSHSGAGKVLPIMYAANVNNASVVQCLQKYCRHAVRDTDRPSLVSSEDCNACRQESIDAWLVMGALEIIRYGDPKHIGRVWGLTSDSMHNASMRLQLDDRRTVVTTSLSHLMNADVKSYAKTDPIIALMIIIDVYGANKYDTALPVAEHYMEMEKENPDACARVAAEMIADMPCRPTMSYCAKRFVAKFCEDFYLPGVSSYVFRDTVVRKCIDILRSPIHTHERRRESVHAHSERIAAVEAKLAQSSA